MPHALFALNAHSDVAKFELEDGVVRGAGGSLLREQSTISRLLIDVPTERTHQLSVDTLSAPWDSTLLISADDAEDSVPANAAELVVEVATVLGHWGVNIVELRDIEKEWVGTATPGSKISFVLVRSAGVDPASFDGWLSAAAADLAERMTDGGCRLITPIRGTNEAPFDAIASFWFPDEESVDAAVETQLFSSFLTSHLVDSGSIRAVSSVEHRRVPNPNAWAMPDGPLMPVPEPEPES